MAKIGRNDPCPCGSGKKYKKCCAGKVIDAAAEKDRIVKRELEQVHAALSERYDHYLHEAAEALDEIRKEVEEAGAPEISEAYVELYAIWAFFNKPVGAKTYFEQFYEKMKPQLRPSAQTVVARWDPVPAFYECVGKGDDSYFYVKELGSKDRIKVGCGEAVKQPEPGSGLHGILVPFNANEHQFLLAYHTVNLEMVKHGIGMNRDLSAEAIRERMKNHYDQFLRELFFEPLNPAELVDHFDWSDERARQAAQCFCARSEHLPPSVQAFALEIWHNYCEHYPANIGKIEAPAAGLEYLMHQLEGNPVTQKEIAKKYGVSVTTVSQRYQALADEYEDMLFESPMAADSFVAKKDMSLERQLEEFSEAMRDKEFESEEDMERFIREYMQQPLEDRRLEKVTEKRKAEDLVDEAWGTGNPKERAALAKEALSLDKDNVDAYVLLADGTGSLESRLAYYQKGVQTGERKLGKKFFEENSGHFWGLIETRPYMRAKQAYAETLAALGKTEQAIEEYEEVLELNPNDNQGVRYSLLT
ncbi:MAG TPA: SEC-C metal-binding domain-containing protein, partial [Bacillales bacterium]|nr:SEC-C metal-binding domain-containing protein [Bacillales bacterium]